ncbi:hypothetical protein THZG08_10164 [Vibrio owensii]|nr:hypothetical protein THZG08_10164 [Vibrio owensii]CAH1548747.1 hypothetical protein THOA03_10163 [Vibrio owensii]
MRLLLNDKSVNERNDIACFRLITKRAEAQALQKWEKNLME